MRLISFVILFLLSGAACQAQGVDSRRVAKRLAVQIHDNYVFADKARQMSNLVTSNAEGGVYDNLSGKGLAEKLHDDLRSVVDDKHLRVRHGPRTRSGLRRQIPDYPNNIGPAKILDGDIGYFEITGFNQPNGSLRTAFAEIFEELKETKAIVIDIRNNGGGSPAGVQLLCSYFFPSQPEVHLNSLYFRNRDSKSDFYTLDKVKGPRLPDVPLYLLTSDYTFSGAEEFAYNLKNLKRATIIGEVTGGGAHPVDVFNLPQGITAIIPVGRAINPITEKNWEAVGVIPHIEVNEEQALDKAKQLINK